MATFERIFFSVMDKLQAFGLVGKWARHSSWSRFSSYTRCSSFLAILGVLGLLVILVILGDLAFSYIRPARSSVGRSHLFTFSLFHPFTFSLFHPFTFLPFHL